MNFQDKVLFLLLLCYGVLSLVLILTTILIIIVLELKRDITIIVGPRQYRNRKRTRE
jgi:hypothetical protein